FDAVDFDPISDAERGFEENRDRTEKVLHAVFGGEGQDRAADAESRDDAGDVDAKPGDGVEDDRRGDHEKPELPENGNEERIGPLALRAQPLTNEDDGRLPDAP